METQKNEEKPVCFTVAFRKVQRLFIKVSRCIKKLEGGALKTNSNTDYSMAKIFLSHSAITRVLLLHSLQLE